MTLNKDEIRRLESLAEKVRENIIRMSGHGGCYIGGSLSCTDIIVYLYSKYLNISKDNLNEPDRDYLFLSKGHDVPALYSTLAELGYIDKERLNNHLHKNDVIYWHPNAEVPGIEFHSGSLGHLISVSIGVALDCKLKNQKNKVAVIVGDGELNEGSIWEACMVAAAYKLDNLLIIVDRNKFQANKKTEELIPLEPLYEKFESFGLATGITDGHSFEELHKILSQVPFEKTKPSVVICETVRGKGVPSLEARSDRWFCNHTDPEVEQLLEELHGDYMASLTSPALMCK